MTGGFYFLYWGYRNWKAVKEAQKAADYIAPVPGGRGFVRWTLEMVMKAQGRWVFDVEKYEKMF